MKLGDFSGPEINKNTSFLICITLMLSFFFEGGWVRIFETHLMFQMEVASPRFFNMG